MIRFLLVAGLATALLPVEAQAKRGGGRSSSAVEGTQQKSRTAIVPVPGISRAKAATGEKDVARVPFPPASQPMLLRASVASESKRPWCGSRSVGGFCVLN